MSLSSCLQKLNSGNNLFTGEEVHRLRVAANKMGEKGAVQSELDTLYAEQKYLSDTIHQTPYGVNLRIAKALESRFTPEEKVAPTVVQPKEITNAIPTAERQEASTVPAEGRRQEANAVPAEVPTQKEVETRTPAELNAAVEAHESVDTEYFTKEEVTAHKKEGSKLNRLLKESKVVKPTTRDEYIDAQKAENDLRHTLEGGDQSTGAKAAALVKKLKGHFFNPSTFDRKVGTVQTVSELPDHVRQSVEDAGKSGFKSKAVFDAKENKVWLIADHISENESLGVLLHEVGVHMGMKNMLGEQLHTELLNKIGQWAKSGEGVEGAIARKAVQRAGKNADAGFAADDETLAYFVEEAVKQGIDPTAIKGGGPVANFLRKLWTAMKGVAQRYGIDPNKMTAQDVVDLAYGAAKMELSTEGSKSNNDIRFSGSQQDGHDIRREMGREPFTPDTRSAYDMVKETLDKAKGSLTNKAAYEGFFDRMADALDVGANLKRAVAKAMREQMPPTAANMEMIRLSTSQTDHATAVADIAMKKGGLTYNPDIKKFEAPADAQAHNTAALDKVYKDMMKAHGITYPEARLYGSDALESKRVLELVKAKADLYALADALDAKGNKAEATKKREKADAMLLHMTKEQATAGMKLYDRYPEIHQLDDIKEGMREWVAKLMRDTGLWSDETSQWMLDNSGWIPFNREFTEREKEEGEGGVNHFISGIQVRTKEKGFKGSEDRAVHDVMDNFESWMQYAIARSISNQKTKEICQTSVRTLTDDEAKFVSKVMPGKEKVTIHYFDNGKLKYVQFDSVAKAGAFKGSEAYGEASLPIIGGFNKIFRSAIINFPLFAPAQLMMDAQSAIASSGIPFKYSYKILHLSIKEAYKTLKGTSEAHERLTNLGLAGKTDYNSTMTKMELESAKELKKLGLVDKYVNLMQHMGMVADNAVRQAVYLAVKQMPGKTEAEAIERAAEYINFRTKLGSSKLAWVGRNVVFMNAFYAATRVSLKVLHGEGTAPSDRAEAKRMLASNMGWLFTMSMGYAMMMSGDDDYERLTPEERAYKWVIPGTGGWGIPMRADPFSLVKAIAETVVRQTSDQADDGTKLRKSMSTIVGNAMFSAPMPVPQPIKVLAELASNHSSFTGRPIVGTALEKVENYKQFGAGTSELSKGIGEGVKSLMEGMGMKSEGASPMYIDHAIRGMLGMYGGAALLASNSMMGNRPSQSMNDMLTSMPGLGRVGAKEFDFSMKDDFYDLAGRVDVAVNTARNIKSTGNVEEYQEYVKDNVELLRSEKHVTKIHEQLTKIRKEINRVSASKGDPDVKAAEVRRLRGQEQTMIRNQNVPKMRERAGL